MCRSNSARFFHTFIKIFILLVAILVVMPFIVDQAMHLFNKGIPHGNNSIIVFKGLIEENKAMCKFLEAFKKITNFM